MKNSDYDRNTEGGACEKEDQKEKKETEEVTGETKVKRRDEERITQVSASCARKVKKIVSGEKTLELVNFLQHERKEELGGTERVD